MATASYALVSARYGRHKPPNNWVVFAVVLVLLGLLFASNSHPKQTQPDAKRVREIQAALVDHGFAPGQTWVETQMILRGIAESHGWQTRRAPDARVLLLLGLGNKYSDQNVLDWPKTTLEKGDPDGNSPR
jgi:hypothetical protein